MLELEPEGQVGAQSAPEAADSEHSEPEHFDLVPPEKGCALPDWVLATFGRSAWAASGGAWPEWEQRVKE